MAWEGYMQRTRWLVIGLLVLAGAGCARRDWVSDLLVLTDVTGTWEGWMLATDNPGAGIGVPRRPITMVLRQTGPKVTGEISWLRGHGQVEGLVSGEVLTFSVGIRAELAVDGDEMWGKVDDPVFAGCRSCFLRFRRESSRVPPPSEPPA